MNTDTRTPAVVIPLTPVESSQLAAAGYDPETGTMAIRFKGKDGPGALYHYANVTQEQADAFAAAPSKGSWFGANLKRATDAHPYTRINEAPVAEADAAR